MKLLDFIIGAKVRECILIRLDPILMGWLTCWLNLQDWYYYIFHSDIAPYYQALWGDLNAYQQPGLSRWDIAGWYVKSNNNVSTGQLDKLVDKWYSEEAHQYGK